MAQTKQQRENREAESNQMSQTSSQRQGGVNQQQGNLGQSTGMARGGESQNRGLARRDQSFSPFSFMRRFSEEMDRLFDDFGFGGGLMSPSFGSSLMSPGFGGGFEQSFWSPQTEIFERGNELVIRADLPGLTKDNINVDIEDNQLIIRGERNDEREQNEQGFYHSERSYGSFYRAIPLPEGIDSEQARADFRNGVLEITMPKPEQKQRGRRLEISETK